MSTIVSHPKGREVPSISSPALTVGPDVDSLGESLAIHGLPWRVGRVKILMLHGQGAENRPRSRPWIPLLGIAPLAFHGA